MEIEKTFTEFDDKFTAKVDTSISKFKSIFIAEINKIYTEIDVNNIEEACHNEFSRINVVIKNLQNETNQHYAIVQRSDFDQQSARFLGKDTYCQNTTFEKNLMHPPDDSHQVLMGTFIEKKDGCQVNISMKPGEAAKAISETIDKLFSGKLLEGFKSIITGTVEFFICDTSMGEKHHQDYHLVFENNSLVRIDSMLYKYNFSSNDIVLNVQNVFCYMFYKSVVALEDVKMAILVNLIMRYVKNSIPDETKQDEIILKYINMLKSLYETLDKSKKSI
ncbi:9389_t:CDS:2 [Gigaspora margarita]|uniref:9389_t:CDS:1 n=1 Tax=Gigaspora margarita TaxID=4874 RepID=A0ABM8VWJ4_GIGMA|nr:9389_t:CDS:2 [Gigaspora margarita]